MPGALTRWELGDGCHQRSMTICACRDNGYSLDYIHASEYKDPIMAPYEKAALRLKALAHPVRLQILDMLRADE